MENMITFVIRCFLYKQDARVVELVDTPDLNVLFFENLYLFCFINFIPSFYSQTDTFRAKNKKN